MEPTKPTKLTSLKKLLAKAYTVQLRYPSEFEELVAQDIKRCFEKTTGDTVKLPTVTPIVSSNTSPLKIEQMTFRQMMPLVWYSYCLRDVLVELKEVRLTKTEDFIKLITHPLIDFLISQAGHPDIKAQAHRSHFFNETRIKSTLKTHLEKMFPAAAQVTSEENSEWAIEIQVEDDRAKLLLSLAHNKLHERKLKLHVSNIAPFREDVAGCLLQELHRGAAIEASQRLYLIPFSGSGTFALELLLRHFECSPFFFDRKTNILQHLFPKTAAYHSRHLIRPQHRLNIVCVDSDPKQVKTSEMNIQRVLEYIPEDLKSHHNFNFIEGDFFKESPPQVVQQSQILTPSEVMFIVNPPYGERLSIDDPQEFYSNIVRQMIAYGHSFSNTLVSGVLIAPKRLTKHCEKIFSKNASDGSSIKMREFRLGGLPLTAIYFRLPPQKGSS